MERLRGNLPPLERVSETLSPPVTPLKGALYPAGGAADPGYPAGH